MPAILLMILVLFSTGAQAEADIRSITVMAEGYVEAVPDTLQLTVSVKEIGPDLAAVQRKVDTLVAKVVDAARDQGVEEDDIDSSRLSAWPEYEWRRDERHYLGEAVQRDVLLKVRELDSYGKLMLALSKLPLHRVDRPVLSHSKLPELQLQALRSAMARGRMKAKTIASEAGGQLGAVLSVSEAGAAAPPAPRMMAEAMRADMGSEPQFSFAKERISAHLEIRYALQ